MKKLYALLFPVFFSGLVQAQQLKTAAPIVQEPCASTKSMEDFLQQHPEYRQIMQQQEEKIRQQIEKNNSVQSKGAANDTTTYIIPVVVHIFHTGQNEGVTAAGLSGIPNPSASQISNSVDQVNKDFNGISNNAAGFPRNTRAAVVKVKMCLATKGPGGVSYPNGCITRWNGADPATWTGAVASGQEAATATLYNSDGVKVKTSGIAEGILRQVVQWDVKKYYNIYLVTELDGNNGGGGYQGFAYYPNSTTTDYAVMIPNSFDGTKSSISTFDHEMGHALNLPHTFSTSVGQEDPNGTGVCPSDNGNCATGGDFICDIPPHKSMLGQGCQADGAANPCGLGVYGEFQDNYMNYTNCSQTFFSADQAKRMRAVIEVDDTRKKQTTYQNLIDCGCGSYLAPKADFLATGSSDSSVTTYVGGNVHFLNYSANATSYLWDFGDNTTSTLQNPDHSYTASGNYTVTLSINNNANSITKTQFVKVIPHLIPTYTPAQGGNFDAPSDHFNAVSPTGSKWVRGNSTYTGKSGTASGTAAWVLEPTKTAYDPGTEAYLYTPSFDFSEDGKYTLSFKTKFLTDFHQDGFIVESSIDTGKTWQKLGTTKSTTWYNDTSNGTVFPLGMPIFTKYIDLNNFSARSFDMSAMKGKPFVAFRFKFKADNVTYSYGGNYGTGVAIDDFSIDFMETTKSIFSKNQTSICQGTTVTYSSQSKGNPTSYNWDFGPGASPATANTAGPHTVVYNTDGVKTVKLKVTNPVNTDSSTTSLSVKPLPMQKNLAASPAAVCPGETASVVIEAAETGVSYQLRKESDYSAVGSPQSGNGTDLSFPPQSVNGPITYNVMADKDGCTAAMVSKSTLNVKSLAEERDLVSQDAELCAGNAGTSVIIKNSENGTTYQIKEVGTNANIGGTQNGNGTDISVPTGTINNSTAYRMVATKNGCTSNLTDTTKVKINPLPNDKNLGMESVKVCPGGSTFVIVRSSDANTTYQLHNNADNSLIGTAMSGTGQDLFLPTGSSTVNMVYKVSTFNGCSSEVSQHPTLTISDPPQARNAEIETAVLCEGKGTNIIIRNAELDVNYLVKRLNNTVLGVFTGQGSDLFIETGSLTSNNKYTIKATLGTCELDIVDQPEVQVLTIDASRIIYAEDRFMCDSGATNIQLQSSEAGIEYTLLLEDLGVGAAKTGNGSLLDFPTGLVKKNTVYTMTARNGMCIKELSDTAAVLIGPKPYVEIVRSGYELRASAGGNVYQWYLDTAKIPGATKSSYTPKVNGMYSVYMARNGCDNTSKPFNYDLIKGISQKGMFSGTAVYPNPTSGTLNIEFPQVQTADFSVIVWNQLGQLMQQQEVRSLQQANYSLDMSKLPAGMYLLELKNEQGSFKQTIAKE